MNREKRRVRLARRQAMLAEARQRAAMRGLADALAEENRSDGLARRSRALVANYSGRAQLADGEALHQAVAFTGGLASLARDANAAQEDAGRQAQWQAQALGEAQTRAKRQSERLAEALAVYSTARERRERDPTYAVSNRPAAGLAQLVQSDAHSSKHRSARPSALPSGRRKRTAQ